MFFGIIDSCLDSDRLSCEKNWTHMPSVLGLIVSWLTKYRWISRFVKLSTGLKGNVSVLLYAKPCDVTACLITNSGIVLCLHSCSTIMYEL